MTATRPRRRGKRAFLGFLLAASSALGNDSPDPGWRVVLVPAFERPPLHENIAGSDTAILAVARPGELGLLEYANVLISRQLYISLKIGTNINRVRWI